MAARLFAGGTVILADRLLAGGAVEVEGGRITAVHASAPAGVRDVIDLGGGYLAPGFVDLHVHGGAGADFMDGTPEAFRTVCRAHARHGTTALLPTTTVARHDRTWPS
jgi:N-acetylglucosamine-6-phosphate deacetylase